MHINMYKAMVIIINFGQVGLPEKMIDGSAQMSLSALFLCTDIHVFAFACSMYEVKLTSCITLYPPI